MLTISRIILTPIIVYLGLTNHIKILIAIAIVIALTDFLDGYLARRWDVKSLLGAKLDAIADKILAIGLLIILIVKTHSFIYILILECIIAMLNLYFYFRKGIAESLMIGKIKTWVIFITIIIGLLDIVFDSWNIPIEAFIYFTLLWQIGSLLSYIKNYIDIKSKKKGLIDDYVEFINLVKPIINHPEFQKRKEFIHHANESVYEHTLRVSYDSYKIAKRLSWDYKAAAIGGLLHDFYYEPWQNNKKKTPFLKKHGFVHAEQARQNAWKYFPEDMNLKVDDIIKKHMFPLNKRPPKYKESWLISIVDKADSMTFLLHPIYIYNLMFPKDEEDITSEGFIKKIKERLRHL